MLGTVGYEPTLETSSGRKILIKKVRILEGGEPFRIGEGVRERWVASSGINHAEFFVLRDDKRREKWVRSVVQQHEAYARLRSKNPVVSRSYGAGEAEFLFSLSKDDSIEMDTQEGRRIFRVKKFYGQDNRTWFVPINDANLDKQQTDLGITFAVVPKDLKEAKARKVVVDLLGKVHPAND